MQVNVITSILKVSDDVGDLGKICGDRTGEEFVSRSNVMYITFVSDCGVNDYGFDAAYQVNGRRLAQEYLYPYIVIIQTAK